jgi:hypothetical protein
MSSSGLEISCANKNQQGMIVRLGGQGWSLSLHEAILGLVHNHIRLCILIGNEYFDVGIRGDGNDSYLVLEPEGKPLSEVEGLLSC